MLLAIAGLLFSGYYAGTKFFVGTCAFGETCPYFLGYPACYYGFTLFVVLTIAAVRAYMSDACRIRATRAIRVVSLIGVLFAGYFTLLELPLLWNEGLAAYFFGLPTCAIGLLVYLALAYFSWRAE